MRILGIDYGEKRIGVSISDQLNIIAQGLCCINRKNIKSDISQIKKIIDEYNIEEIIIGLPLRTDGSKNKNLAKFTEFAEEVKKIFNKKINFWDERYTTIEAEKLLITANISRKKRKQIIDKTSAAILLQSYLDKKNEKI